jgi:hypothetical protein
LFADQLLRLQPREVSALGPVKRRRRVAWGAPARYHRPYAYRSMPRSVSGVKAPSPLWVGDNGLLRSVSLVRNDTVPEAVPRSSQAVVEPPPQMLRGLSLMPGWPAPALPNTLKQHLVVCARPIAHRRRAGAVPTPGRCFARAIPPSMPSIPSARLLDEPPLPCAFCRRSPDPATESR